MGSERAAAELARAGAITGRVRDRSRWLAVMFGAFSGCFGVVTLVLGLVAPRPGMLVPTVVTVLACVAVLLTGTLVWAFTRPAQPRGRGRGAWAWISTGTLYAAALLAGTYGHLSLRVAYWVPAAIVVAAPLAVAAFRERRR